MSLNGGGAAGKPRLDAACGDSVVGGRVERLQGTLGCRELRARVVGGVARGEVCHGGRGGGCPATPASSAGGACGVCAGVAGGLYAHHIRFISPDSFGFVESVTVLAMVILGGIGSIWGVAVAAAVLSVMPLWFQFVDDYKLLLYGALLFLTMRFAPDGLAGIARRLRLKVRQ